MLFATDPPYMVDYDGTHHPGGGRVKSRTARPLTANSTTSAAKRRSTKNKDWSGTYGVTWDDADGNSGLYDKFIAAAVAEAIAPNAA